MGQENDFIQMTHMREFALERITSPTLILQGTADKNVNPAMADYAHAHIAGSELVKLPGYDHFMVIYAHKQLQDIIAKFLRAHMAK